MKDPAEKKRRWKVSLLFNSFEGTSAHHFWSLLFSSTPVKLNSEDGIPASTSKHSDGRFSPIAAKAVQDDAQGRADILSTGIGV